MTTRTSGFSPTGPCRTRRCRSPPSGGGSPATRTPSPGYALSAIEITDPGVIAASGQARHPIITATGDNNDRVDGVVYEITPAELEAADRYEVGDYQRVRVRLASGTHAWAYINSQA
jgi:hypothetical protein